ncbi:MAG: glucose 1-dehydrogenase [Synechococcales bacterium]|nr:glucose 1-dehydrogenase [Synechococcales bacterium]
MKGLAGKNVLVTGASTGIGRAIAIRFAQEGANVAINYYKGEDEAQETEDQLMEEACGQVQQCGVQAIIVQADVSQEEDVLRLFSTTIDKLGSVDILVNNAGIQSQAPSHQLSVDKFDRMVAINLRGAFLCSRTAIQHFLGRGYQGTILNTSSVHEIIPRPGYVGYSVSKGGMRTLTQTLALEYADRGIRVNAIAPGATDTPINPWAENPQKRSNVEGHIPMGRIGTPEEMAAAAAFLVSDEASYITGQTLFIDGGLTLYPTFRAELTEG